MRAAFVTIGLVEASKISSWDQGAEFNKCISITDFQTKDLNDDITLVDRDGNGCCAAGYVPGKFLTPDYQGPQIVCGTGTGDQRYGSLGACNYGTCYVYKQNLPCADGTKQRLNGCCAAHSGTFSNFADTCLGYELTFSNSASESVEYCTTYHKKYSSIGPMGTTKAGDDVKYALQWLGGTPPAADTPLKVCQGDCDVDDDCPGSSTCDTVAAKTNCGVGDSTDSSRSETDYCSNPAGSPVPSLQISCLDEYAACCGHATRNGACAKSTDDYMAATNTGLTENACSAASFNNNDDDDDDTSTKNNSNASDNAAVASLGCAVLLTFGAIVV